MLLGLIYFSKFLFLPLAGSNLPRTKKSSPLRLKCYSTSPPFQNTDTQNPEFLHWSTHFNLTSTSCNRHFPPPHFPFLLFQSYLWFVPARIITLDPSQPYPFTSTKLLFTVEFYLILPQIKHFFAGLSIYTQVLYVGRTEEGHRNFGVVIGGLSSLFCLQG